MPLNKIRISSETLRQIDEIDEFNRLWRQKMSANDAVIKLIPRVALREFIQPEKYSQDEKITDKVLEEIFTQLSHRPRIIREIDNQKDLLYRIYQNYKNIPLSEDTVKQIHQIIFKDSPDIPDTPGQYKNRRNRITLRHKSGQLVQNLLEPPSPEDTPEMIIQLIEWTNNNLISGKIHPLVIIGLFMVRFLAVHPFIDGNGRIVRLLAVLLLLKAGYLYVPYASFEAFMTSDKYTYYHTLYMAHTVLKDDNYFLRFFIWALHQQKCHIETKIKNIKENPLFAISLSILNLWAENQNLDTTALADILKFDQRLIEDAVTLIKQKNYILKVTN